ncbi:DUF937 domain-containing protein [Methylobacterium sp. Leaf100]|uniref:DUF937 domain-containing protein n=1 Tax=Methylobacterium sp. Leaf100 TaxID=1736252 RepID=UPI000700834B|nr:DUF937 domain-containing protein [Methylobacterium sp. Leaf100]KQP36038.1 hypothetical protein ASF25_13860 [Methylobacterium sp. Leaf100]
MFNLFDILQAQAGPGAQGFGQQFGLSQDQTRRAMEALLPALTMGLQRNAANDPTGFAHLFSLAGAGATAPRPSASPQMDMLVRQLFGSPHLSQAVLQQAAGTSGIATPVLKQMLPVMAGMVVAGIVHVMINQTPQAAPAPAPNAFGIPPNPYWTDMVNAFMTAGGALAPGMPAPKAPPVRTAAKPTRLAPQPAPARVPPGQSAPATNDAAPFELFQQMFQSGLDVQQENAKAMQRLFDTFWQEGRQQEGGRNANPSGDATARTGSGKAESGKSGGR